MFNKCLLSICIFILSACGGSGSQTTRDNEAEVIEVPNEVSQEVNWENVITAIQSAPIDNLRLIVGTSETQLLSYEKGNFTATSAHDIASASKLLGGIVLYRLVEQGLLTLSDTPQAHIEWWTDDPIDPRSAVTLEQLLSFTSGFNDRPSDVNCINSARLITPDISLEECVEHLYDDAIDETPGATFSYGPEHLQIAALMAEKVRSQDYTRIFESELVDHLELSSDTALAQTTEINPWVAAGVESTAQDYARILQGLLAGDLINNVDEFLRDRTPQDRVLILNKSPNLTDDWHYAMGAWRFCPEAVWSEACENLQILTSPGAKGWTPWIDFENGYYGLIAMEERRDDGATAPVNLMMELMPLIEANLP
jgi:CubicO group peptidase (beta-lactamase class C family)